MERQGPLQPFQQTARGRLIEKPELLVQAQHRGLRVAVGGDSDYARHEAAPFLAGFGLRHKPPHRKGVASLFQLTLT
jgi:hypothetical protein